MLTLALRNHARLLGDTLRPGPESQGRLTLKRAAVMGVFLPAYTLIQSVNATGLALDRLLFPGFRKVVVNRPVFVLGMPRSGTTFLHRLLAKDEKRFTSTRLWELIFAPSITQRYFWLGVGRVDRVLGRPLGRSLALAENVVFGWFGDVHQTGLRDTEEDYLALSLVGACFLLVLPFPVERVWRLAYFDEQLSPKEQCQVMTFYKSLVQRHLYVHGTERRFLSKNPSFTPVIRTLVRQFPDAQFIACYRTPEAAAPSLVSSLQQGARLFDHRDPSSALSRKLIAMLKFQARHLLTNLTPMERDQYALMAMEDLTPEPRRQIERLYTRLGWEPTNEYKAVLNREEHKARGYTSRHRYSLANLGLDKTMIERDLGPVIRELADADQKPSVTETSDDVHTTFTVSSDTSQHGNERA
ncbi:sulfotransferase [Vreelandella utahensis]|uniref:sulfotransferase n=1 Tax=Vreelandella halophila TaxID=86177 RepID=UPI0009850DD7|nr:sulfotransferase [Halomonas utahensis]